MKEKLLNRVKNKLCLNTRFNDKFWVYAVYDWNENLVFMYYGKLEDIISMRPFKINEKFIEGNTYTYALLGYYNTKIEAENALGGWMKESELEGSTPPYNIYNRVYNNDKYIYCEEDGRYYRTAQDIIKIFRVTQSAISNHLRGVTGYKSVKGLHFRYVHNIEPGEIELIWGMKMQKGQLGGYKYVQSDNPLNVEGLTQQQIQDIIERIKMQRFLNGGAL